MGSTGGTSAGCEQQHVVAHHPPSQQAPGEPVDGGVELGKTSSVRISHIYMDDCGRCGLASVMSDGLGFHASGMTQWSRERDTPSNLGLSGWKLVAYLLGQALKLPVASSARRHREEESMDTETAPSSENGAGLGQASTSLLGRLLGRPSDCWSRPRSDGSQHRPGRSHHHIWAGLAVGRRENDRPSVTLPSSR